MLKNTAFVLAAPDHGRMVITAANVLARQQGIDKGMTVADARTIISGLQVIDDKPELPCKLLKGLAEWCIRYTPAVSLDLPDGLVLDVSGCPHLWGGEKLYLADIVTRLKDTGYNVRAAMADTIGSAWAIAHFGKDSLIIESGRQTVAILSLPPEALRTNAETIELLHNLGLKRISNFISMPRSALRRRFGQQLIKRIDQALGVEEEIMQPVLPIAPYQERLPCPEPIVTATGIEIGKLEKLNDFDLSNESVRAKLKERYGDNIPTEEIVISPADIETVKQQIVTVWEKIQARDFYIGCGKRDCNWCNFVKDNKLAVAMHDPAEEEEPVD
jgi:protein ImuB